MGVKRSRHRYTYIFHAMFLLKKNRHFLFIEIQYKYINNTFFFFRKAKLQITREVSRQHHPHNSALSADINISEPPLSSGAQKVKKIYSLYYS